jgi:hypothetical protein
MEGHPPRRIFAAVKETRVGDLGVAEPFLSLDNVAYSMPPRGSRIFRIMPKRGIHSNHTMKSRFYYSGSLEPHRAGNMPPRYPPGHRGPCPLWDPFLRWDRPQFANTAGQGGLTLSHAPERIDKGFLRPFSALLRAAIAPNPD